MQSSRYYYTGAKVADEVLRLFRGGSEIVPNRCRAGAEQVQSRCRAGTEVVQM